MSTPASSSAALPIAYIVLRILIVLNWLMGAAILALLVVMPNEQWIMARSSFLLRLKRSGWSWACARSPCSVSSVIPLNYVVLKRLLAIVETVRAGDPFVAANASRLQAIAWALLALQLLSLVIGAIGKTISTPAHPRPSRCRLFDQRLARRTPHVPAGPRVRGRRAHARRPRRDGVTWRSPSSSTTCSTIGG